MRVSAAAACCPRTCSKNKSLNRLAKKMCPDPLLLLKLHQRNECFTSHIFMLKFSSLADLLLIVCDCVV